MKNCCTSFNKKGQNIYDTSSLRLYSFTKWDDWKKKKKKVKKGHGGTQESQSISVSLTSNLILNRLSPSSPSLKFTIILFRKYLLVLTSSCHVNVFFKLRKTIWQDPGASSKIWSEVFQMATELYRTYYERCTELIYWLIGYNHAFWQETFSYPSIVSAFNSRWCQQVYHNSEWVLIIVNQTILRSNKWIKDIHACEELSTAFKSSFTGCQKSFHTFRMDNRLIYHDSFERFTACRVVV